MLARLEFSGSHDCEQITRVLRDDLATACGRYRRRMTTERLNSAVANGRWERAGAVAVFVEAAMVATAGGALAAGWIAGRVSGLGSTIFLVAFSAAIAAGLVAVSRALARGARWPRGAAVTWQVLHAAVALGSTGSRWWLAAALVAPVPFALGGILAATLRTQREQRSAAA